MQQEDTVRFFRNFLVICSEQDIADLDFSSSPPVDNDSFPPEDRYNEEIAKNNTQVFQPTLGAY